MRIMDFPYYQVAKLDADDLALLLEVVAVFLTDLILPLRTKCILALGCGGVEQFYPSHFKKMMDFFFPFEQLISLMIYIDEGSVNPEVIFCLFCFHL